VTGVKVMDISEMRKLTLQQSVFRDSFYLIIEIIALIYFSFLAFKIGDHGYHIAEYRNFADQPILWWTIIELITMLTNSKKRALHDFLAKSVVIKT
jgi:uncharacterized RDD family membrane protein YckC